jgi:hypothetical protein
MCNGRKLLYNLARRLRMARICKRRAEQMRFPEKMIEFYRGQETEAWNSFQAAKAIIRDA